MMRHAIFWGAVLGVISLGFASMALAADKPTKADAKAEAEDSSAKADAEDAPAKADAEDDLYEFVPPPGENWNRLYRVNRKTGEVGACQFIPKENSVGSTMCLPAGEGAGPQAKGEYGLVASKLALEGGVYRVNKRTGEMSVCFIVPDKVVCTDPSF
jgi:hypothetical protein